VSSSPCRNEEGYIQETIERVAGQEGAGERFTLEILIVRLE